METGHLDGVFMHKKAQKLKFLCERNDKVPGLLKCNSNDMLCFQLGFRALAHKLYYFLSLTHKST